MNIRNIDELILQIQNNDFFSNSQKFFLQRSLEILDNKTIPSYSLKYLNSHIAIQELIEVADNTQKNVYPSNEHFKNLFTECNKFIAQDPTFNFDESTVFKKLLQKTLNDYGKKENLNMLISKLNVENMQLEEKYLSWIVSGIKHSIQHGDLKTLDSLCNYFISELINCYGWSTRGIFIQYHKMIESSTNQPSTTNAFSTFFNIVSKEREKYTCYFQVKNQLNPDYLSSLNSVDIFYEKGTDLLASNNTEFTENLNESKIYLFEEVYSYDFMGAVDSAWDNLTKKFGLLDFFNHNKIQLIEQATVLVENDNTFCKRNIIPTIFLVKNKSNGSQNQLDTFLSLDENTKQKIHNCFEFIKNSKDSKSTETKFINQWVALESIASSNQYKSIFINISEVVNTMLFSRNFYIQINDFYKMCRNANIPVPYNILNSGTKNLSDFLKYILDDEVAITNHCSTYSEILHYRCKEIIKLINTPLNTEKYITSHYQKIDWHLRRLYRVRNSLAHSGETKQNIILFFNHLNFYLENLISEIIYRMDKNNFNDIELLYAHMNDNYTATVEFLKTNPTDRDKYIECLLTGFL